MEEFSKGQSVMIMGFHAKIFGLYSEDDQHLLHHFQEELRKFPRSVLLKEASSALSQIVRL